MSDTHVHQKSTHPYWLVAVGGEVFSDQTDDETTPQSSGHTEEHVPVPDNAVLVLSEDASELSGQGTQADGQDSLQ